MAKKRRKKSEQTVESAARSGVKAGRGGKGTWRVMDRGTTIVGGILAQRVSAAAWRAATGKRPPTSGEHPDVSTTEAVAWAAIGGATIELVRVGVSRWAANYWVRSTGQLPPGMKPLGAKGSSKAQEPAPKEPAPTQRLTRKVSRRSRGR